jgi:hypothetical protein
MRPDTPVVGNGQENGYHPAMALVLSLLAGLLVGIGVGIAIGRGPERRLLERLARTERTLRDRILPSVERQARRLEIAVRSVPPLVLDGGGRIVSSGVDTAEHIAELCESINERETSNSLALSDTVQLAQKELGDVKKLRKM